MSTTRPPATYSRKDIADAILSRLDSSTVEELRNQFASNPVIQWFAVDDLLPVDMAHTIRRSFPQPGDMRERKTLREHKHVAAQMDRHDAQGEEALFAFQEPQVLAVVAQITGLRSLTPDPALYAGGLSLMTRGHFLNPHLDNSHNNDRTLYRALNLLYYASPDWTEDSGGHLELWPAGVRGTPITVHSAFNRLVVMTTGPQSWHSVCAVRSDQARCCVSNYYFSPDPIGGKDYFRVTSFRGRPEQPLRDLMLRVDGTLRQAVRKIRPKGLVQTTHIYRRPDGRDR